MKKILVLLFCIAILTGCKSENNVVYQFEGNSMSPTIKHQQKVVVDKDYYINNEIKRDDIVLINLEEIQHIKRVIGLPNELIQILDGTIYIDNKPIESEFEFVNVWENNLQEEGIQLRSDEYFIIGDSNTSKDSRSIGPLTKEDILGKVVEIK